MVAVGCQPLLFGARAEHRRISGTAVVEGKPIPSITVRLRNMDNGRLTATATTNERGEFKFDRLPAGNYVVETVARDGATLLGTSPPDCPGGTMVASGVTVSTSAAAVASGPVRRAQVRVQVRHGGGTGAGAARGGLCGCPSWRRVLRDDRGAGYHRPRPGSWPPTATARRSAGCPTVAPAIASPSR